MYNLFRSTNNSWSILNNINEKRKIPNVKTYRTYGF